MNNERLSVVDELDRVLETRLRGEVHALGLRHRAVHILVFNNETEMFIQKRAMTKDINPGLWDTAAAGHVDAGESYADCAIRELKEELGVAVAQTPERLFKLPAGPETGMEFVEVYRLVHPGPFQLAKDEIDEGRWIALDEFDAWLDNGAQDVTTTLKAIWREFRTAHRAE